MRSDDSRRPGRRAAAAPAPDAARDADGTATSPSSSGVPRPRPVPLWHSLRLRIAAGVAAVAIGVSGVAGAVVDNAAAVDGRERLRAQALERLESAVIFYDARGLTRFGAVLDDPGLPAGMAERAVPEQRVTFYDGTTMYAAQRINPRDVLSVRLPGDELARQRSALRWSFGQAAAIGAAIASLLGWLVGTWLSRRLRAGAQAAARIAAGDTGARATQPGRDEVALLTTALDGMAAALQHRLEIERAFTADVAHELRSPVTGLVSAAELLPDDELGGLVRRQVARLRRLVEDLLEISRLDAAAVPIDWQHCHLGDVVTTALDQHAADVDLRVDRAGVVLAEPRRVERIVTNLVRNALAYGARPVRVDVEGARVRVVDAGPGFPPELVQDGPRRFATFTVGKGSGLGLTIAAKHAEAMGGALALTNLPAPRTGACAEVTFRPAPVPDADTATGGRGDDAGPHGPA